MSARNRVGLPAEDVNVKRKRWVGISFHKGAGTWTVELVSGGFRHRLGGYPSAHVAALARDRLALHVGSAKNRELNFPRRKLEAASPEKLREELRALTRSRFTSRYRGVSRMPNSERWKASIYVLGHTYNLHGFESEDEAARTRDRLALSLLGPRAKLNFPDSGLCAATFEGIRPANSVVTRRHAMTEVRTHGDTGTVASGSGGMGEAGRALA